MAFYENVEKIFLEEIREKKKAGTGAFSKRGKGVKHGISGALKTPFFYMSNKEKKELNGEITVTNMYTTIIPYQELKLKDDETQKQLLIKWREVFDNEKIIAELGITKTAFWKLMQTLEIPRKHRGGNRTGTVKKKAAAPKTSVNLELELEEPKRPVVVETIQEPQVQKIITKGLYLEYNGDYNADDLNKLFTKLQLLIDGETNKYNISLSLSEKED